MDDRYNIFRRELLGNVLDNVCSLHHIHRGMLSLYPRIPDWYPEPVGRGRGRGGGFTS